MSTTVEDESLMPALADLVEPILGPGKNVTARSLSKVWETLAPSEKVLPFYGRGGLACRQDCHEDNHVFSNFHYAQKHFKFTVPKEIWNIPEALTRDQRVHRTIWCHCAEKAIMLCKAAAMGDAMIYWQL